MMIIIAAIADVAMDVAMDAATDAAMDAVTDAAIDAVTDAAMDAAVDAVIRIHVQELEEGLTEKGLEMDTGPVITMLPGAEEDRTEAVTVDAVRTADSRQAADLNVYYIGFL